jgi:hypothetical protein
MWLNPTPVEICPLLGCYAASSGNPLPTFRDNVSVPSSRVKKSNDADIHWAAASYRQTSYIISAILYLMPPRATCAYFCHSSRELYLCAASLQRSFLGVRNFHTFFSAWTCEIDFFFYQPVLLQTFKSSDADDIHSYWNRSLRFEHCPQATHDLATPAQHTSSPTDAMRILQTLPSPLPLLYGRKAFTTWYYTLYIRFTSWYYTLYIRLRSYLTEKTAYNH